MHLVIIGNGGLAARFAARSSAAGHEVYGAGPSASEAWPAEVPFAELNAADELAKELSARAPAVVLVFGADRGARLAVPVAEVLRIVGSLHGARLIYWGSARVYGRPADVVGRVLLEGAPLAANGRAAAALAADNAAQDVAEARPGDVHLFRAAEIVGGGSEPVFPALGRLSVVPTPASHRHLQLLDPRDALEVLDRAVAGGHPGIYNVTADGILKVDEACRALGKSTVRLPRGVLPLVAYGARWTGKIGSARELLRLTAGTPLLDNARLKTHFGFRPRFTTRQALAAARDGTGKAAV